MLNEAGPGPCHPASGSGRLGLLTPQPEIDYPYIMSEISPMLRRLMKKTQERTERGKIERPIPELRERIKDAPPLISFADAISGGLCLIAEIKQASPSMGSMKQENVE